MEFKYYTTRRGSAVRRFGTEAFIGCKRSPRGFVWKPNQVSRIPASEVAKNAKTYRRAVECGALVEVTEHKWDEWIQLSEVESRKKAAASEKVAPPPVEEKPEQSLDAVGAVGSEIQADQLPSRSRRSKKPSKKKKSGAKS